MTNLSQINQEVINKLKLGYDQLSPTRKLFFPSGVKNFLEQHTPHYFAVTNQISADELHLFFQALTDSHVAGFSFSCLRLAYDSPLYKALSILKGKQLLTNVYSDLIAGNNNPLQLTKSLVILHDAHLLPVVEISQFAQQLKHTYAPDKVASVLVLLKALELLTLDRALAVIRCHDLDNLLVLIPFLQELKLLSGHRAASNLDQILHSRYLNGLVSALQKMQNKGLLQGDRAQDNFEKALFKYPKGDRQGPCTDRYEFAELTRIIQELANHIEVFDQAGLLSGEQAQNNFDMMTSVKKSNDLIAILRLMNKAGLITPETNQAILDHLLEQSNLGAVYTCIYRMQYNGWLRADTWQLPCIRSLQDIAFDADTAHYLYDIPNHLFTLDHFLAIRALCEQHRADHATGRRHLILYIRREILGIVPGAETTPHVAADINTAQSTHVESVHISVAESARTLKQLYGARANTEKTVHLIHEEIHYWLQKQPDDSAAQSPLTAAKKALQVLRKSSFIEPLSGVSLQELLALTWIAIHDDSKRTGTLDDAQKLFIEGLYECQRGYNLSEEGVDNGKSDLPICHRGSFNKAMEKIRGVHPDVNVIYITPKTINDKFYATVREEAYRYLRTQKICLGEQEFSSLLTDVLQGGVGLIWSQINTIVSERMMDEFGSTLSSGETESRLFRGLLDSAQYITIMPDKVDDSPAPASSSSSAGFFAEEPVRVEPLVEDVKGLSRSF